MVVVRDDVTAWWELCREEESGTTFDEHNQHDGTLNGGVSLSNDTPLAGGIGSFDFDGTDDYIQIPDSMDFSIADGDGFSVAFWVKFDTTGSFESVLGHGDRGTAGGYFLVQKTSGDAIRFGIGDGSTENFNDSTGTLSASTWYHVVCTFDGSTMTNYIDASVDGSSSYDPGAINGSTDFYIGARFDGSVTQFTDGHICGVRYFNRALTSTEISTDYNSGDGVTYRSFFDLEGDAYTWYKYDGNANDAVGNSNGTVTGATSGAQGRIGTAYSFDGTDDLIDTNVQIQDIEAADGSFTYGMWLKKDNTSIESPLGESGSTYYFNWYIRPSDNLWGVSLYDGTTLNNYQDNPSSMTTGEYQLYVITYDGSTLKKYLNGVEVGSHTATVDLSGITDTVVHGRRQTGSPQWWSGDIDEPFHFQRCLPPGEVRRLYSFGAGLRYEDLNNESFLIDRVAAAWGFTEGSGTTVADLKNNTHDMTLVGSPAWGSTGVPSELDNYVVFNPANGDYGTVPDADILDMGTDDKSIASWAYTEDKTARNPIVFKGDTSASWYVLGFAGSGFSDNIEFFLDDGTTNSILRTGAASISNNTWHQIGGGRDADTELEVYIDGTSAGTGGSEASRNVTSSEVLEAGTANTELGTDANNNIRVSQIIMFNGELSSTEWNAYYNGGSGVQFPFFEEAVVVTDNAMFFAGGF